jgi:hypothetical protein
MQLVFFYFHDTSQRFSSIVSAGINRSSIGKKAVKHRGREANPGDSWEEGCQLPEHTWQARREAGIVLPYQIYFSQQPMREMWSPSVYRHKRWGKPGSGERPGPDIRLASSKPVGLLPPHIGKLPSSGLLGPGGVPCPLPYPLCPLSTAVRARWSSELHKALWNS